MWILISRIRPGVGLLLFAFLCTCCAQENTQKRVPDSLLECYRDPRLLDRDNRLPATLTTLLDLIRKVEADPETQFSLRDMALGLLHRFRVDGIQKAPGVSSSASVIPYSTTGFQFPKHALIFTRLLPGTGKPFPNNTLTDVERCSLHFMLSSTIETQVRGDESMRCGSLAQYRSLRLPRRTSDYDMKQEAGRRRDKENIEYGQEDFGAERVDGNQISQCPVESGVMRTKWGAVAVGPLIAGIASGLERQSVQVRTLLSLSRSNPKANQAIQPAAGPGANQVDNLFATTLAGDVAEVALYQGHLDYKEVGSPGAWNSTNVPRWYFLSKQKNNEMTDAEIRGGLDGLIMGTQIREWARQASSLKLSSLLDMYYSQRGVFSGDEKACRRRELFTAVAPERILKDQAVAFATVVEREIVLPVSLTSEGIVEQSVEATTKLIRYVPGSLNDLNCESTAPNPGRESAIAATATELYIILDTTWRYSEIVQIISLILDGLDAREFGSRFTVMNAKDLSIMVNTTYYASDFHSQFNETTYRRHPIGFDIQRVLTELKPRLYKALEYEHTNSMAGGRSQVALFIPSTASLTEADLNFAQDHMEIMNEEVPDLRVLFFAGGAVNRFSTLVREEAKDLFPLSINGDNLAHVVNPVLERISQVPRRIVNYHCDSQWKQEGQGNVQFDDYIEPSAVNFYRLHPNYFFGNADRKVRVQGHGYGALTVCYSRKSENPVANATLNTNEDNDVNCRQITSETIEIDLSNACEDDWIIHDCKPLYISVTAPPSATDGNYRCDAKECRAPDNLRVTINTENLGCYSGVSCIISSLSLIFAVLCIQLVQGF